MSYQHDRDRFMAQATVAGIDVTTAQKLLSAATTLQRLAEAQCNGDWPFDNGKREVAPCPVCEVGTVPSQLKSHPNGGSKACSNCRLQARVHQLLISTSYLPSFGGDPRGPVLKLYPVGTLREDIESGRAKGIWVPERTK